MRADANSPHAMGSSGRSRRLLLGLAGSLLLAGCGQKPQPQPVETGAATQEALADRIVVDPRMTGAAGEAQAVPAPLRASAAPLAQGVAEAARISEGSRQARTDCAAKAQYSADWAGKLPAAIPVHPRGTVREAAGTDADGCALRVVSYVVPVSPGEVAGFTYAAARKGGFSAEYRIDGTDHVVGGGKGGQAFVVFARKRAEGGSEVDVMTAGR